MHVRSLLYLFAALFLLGGCASGPTTVKGPDSYFKEAEAAYASKNFKEAIELWRKVKESDSAPELTTQAELKIADAHFENKEYIEAAAAYEDFRKLHPTHEKAPYALYRLGLSHYNQIAGVDTDQTPVKNAVIVLESFLNHYPSSQYAAEVSQKLADCHVKQLAYENYVANFYMRTKKYPAAIKRLNEAFSRFPGLKHDETLYLLGKTHMKAGEEEKGKGYLQRLASEYPDSRFNREAAALLPGGFASYTSQGR